MIVQTRRRTVLFDMGYQDDVLLPELSITASSAELAGRIERTLAAGKGVDYQGFMQLVVAHPPELGKYGWRIPSSPAARKILGAQTSYAIVDGGLIAKFWDDYVMVSRLAVGFPAFSTDAGLEKCL
jgi:hypothetical protein